MIGRLVIAAAGLGAFVLACNATPDIPNDLRSNNPTYPGRGSKANNNSDDSETSGEGEVLTGGRTPTPSNDPPTTADGGATTTEDAGTTPIDSGTTVPTNNQCAGSATQSACFKCCETQNPGTATKWNQFWDDCACATNRCGNVCAQSWCAGFLPTAGDACDNCLNTVSAQCSTQADAVCKQDATCAPLVACDEGSACAAKPQ